MRYRSTRGGAETVTAGQAILKGLADDGGLYVPETIPLFDKPLAELTTLPYPALAYEILKLYLTDYTEAELRHCVESAYTCPGNFTDPLIAPLREADGVFFLELFHGRTLAFKDMALSLLPYLLTTAANHYRPGVKTVVLTATSGDTGKAALEGFADVEGTKVAVFFPNDGVSAMQKKQMVTQEGSNTFVIGVQGNFDDTQTGVKKIFNDRKLAAEMAEKGLAFSSANSINIGRLLPQVVYYVHAYGLLVKKGAVAVGDTVDFTVPTGNFGNILAGYYAKCMGLPIGKLICASNKNHVLFDFIRTGAYDTNRAFVTTISPSMDILISSNLERLLFHTCCNTDEVEHLMSRLATSGRYHFNHVIPDFYAAYATEDETRAAIHEMASRGYVTDPHTAVAYHAYRQFIKETESTAPHIIMATASPFKFAADVCAAVSGESNDMRDATEQDSFCFIEELVRVGGISIPEAILQLRHKKTRHTTVCRVEDMQETLLNTVLC